MWYEVYLPEGIQSFTDIVSPHCSGLSANAHLARIRDVLGKGVALLCNFS